MIWGVFLLGLWEILRVAALYEQGALLRAQAANLDPSWRFWFAAFWAVCFLILSAGLLFRQPGARPLLIACLVIYSSYNLLLLLVFVQAPIVKQSLPARALLFIGALVYAIWALYRPANRPYWENENSENSARD